MTDHEGRLSEPMPPELEERLRPKAKTFRTGSGYPATQYIEVVRRVHETREGRWHIERDFPNVHPKHVAQVLRKQSSENGFAVAVGDDDAHGVYAMYAGRDEPDDGSQAITD